MEPPNVRKEANKKGVREFQSLAVCEKLALGCVLDGCWTLIPGSLTSSPVPDVTEQLSRAEQNPRCRPGGSPARDWLRGPGEGAHRGGIRSLQQGHALPNSHRW